VARLIELPAGPAGTTRLVGRVGDLLAFAASGGDVGAGPPVLERLGPFQPAVVGLDGRVLAPEGPPTSVLFVARAPGRATVEVAAGDPWSGATITTYVVEIDG
jgi:hypothetical protein